MTTDPDPDGCPLHMHDAVTISFPADAGFLPLVRVAGAVMGDRAHLSHPAIEDVRLALDELVYLLLGSGEGHIELSFQVGNTGLHVSASRRGDDAPLTRASDTVTGALAAAVDVYEVHEGVTPGFTFLKTARQTRPDGQGGAAQETGH